MVASGVPPVLASPGIGRAPAEARVVREETAAFSPSADAGKGGLERVPLLRRSPAAAAEDDDEHEALAGGVGREEIGHLVVVGGRADRAEAERVGGEVQLPGGDR